MLSALSDAGAEFLLVGAHAVAVHGHPRATGDLDIWVNPTQENAENVWRAVAFFGAPMNNLDLHDFAEPDLIFQIGVVPNRIDILTAVTGLEFEKAWERRIVVPLDGLEVPVLGRADLIRNKKAVGRPQDVADAERLEEGS
ncbi:MAG: hypothetical protein ABR527_10860 [Gemmatimonadota bacterium]